MSYTRVVKVVQHRFAQKVRNDFLLDFQIDQGRMLDAPIWIPTGSARGVRASVPGIVWDYGHNLRSGG